jgi:hypothetical protein
MVRTAITQRAENGCHRGALASATPQVYQIRRTGVHVRNWGIWQLIFSADFGIIFTCRNPKPIFL